MKNCLAIVLIVILTGCSSASSTVERQTIQTVVPTGTSVTTATMEKSATAVKQGVLRVICRSPLSAGTGFLHRSGNIITAAHVVEGCKEQGLFLATPNGKIFLVESVDADILHDLALVKPKKALPGQALHIAPAAPPVIGMQVATWGYPGGYNGLSPLLSVGYLAGVQDFKDQASGQTIQRLVVNAAFNGGNSGGPLLSLENGDIVGVVVSKLTPFPHGIAIMLDGLSKQRSGFQYTVTNKDGSIVNYSEGQVVSGILNYLRTQVQLVIGYAVSTKDIEEFLKARNINP